MEKLEEKSVRFLKWLEKYIKTDMLYLAKGGFWGILSQFVTSAMTFAMAIAFAHFVSKETYGQYKYVLSIISLLGTLTLTGLGTAVMQSISRGYDGTLSYAFWKNIKWSIFFFAGAGITAIYYFLHGNTTIAISLLVAGCLWPFFNSTNLYSSLLIAKKDFRRVALYFDIVGNFVPYFCLFVTMFLTKNPLWFVIVYIISNTTIGIILYWRIVLIYKPNKEVDPHMLGYSKHLSLMGILSGISENIDQILVFHYVGAAELAIYNFATAIPDQIKGPTKSLANLIFPKFVERSDKEIHAGIKNKMMVLLVSSILIIAVYIFAAPYIYKIFFPKYTESIIYSQIFSLSIIAIVAIPASSYLTARKKIKQLYTASIFMSIFQITIDFVSIIYWGLLGLIFARVIVRVVSAVLNITLCEVAIKKEDEVKI
jgi:O-antigen/teichoic acid export membrane protein